MTGQTGGCMCGSVRYQLGAELYSRDDGTTFYEIDWMTEDGRKAHFTVDAQSGSVTNRRGG